MGTARGGSGGAWFAWRLFALVLCLAFAGIFPVADATAESGANVRFIRHTLNAKSEFSSCCVMDVNHDGRLDVFSGGFWYEAPPQTGAKAAWKRHVVRQVESIRGRYDDYSNLPLDVNGDGWMDVVSVNYRSKSLYWVRHPGKDLSQAWTRRLIDTPGPSETGRLVDLDRDGQLDVLPNGVKFSGWYRFEREGGKVRWLQEPLPEEARGHGLGFGDLNGDRRVDIVSPRGWLEAPANARTERWRWREGYEGKPLHRDSSVPILVVDVNGDGLNDLVWSRAHNIGLYWLESHGHDHRDHPNWTRHTIDSEVSSNHSLLWGDINGDGRSDLIAGKRYLAHDGKDPGEYDPLAIYWYEFLPESKSWQRHTISPPGMIGFDLDPKLVDLDADGDLDIVAPSRNGLHWFENVPAESGVAASSSELAPPRYPDHTDLSQVWSAGKLKPIETRFDWGLRRRHILLGMQQAMGPLPAPRHRVPIRHQVRSADDGDGYTRFRITFTSETGDDVPAFLLKPNDISAPAPAMLCLHQTTSIGKGEPAGLGGRDSLHYAHELARRGYVCLVPDYPSFGDYKYDFSNGKKSAAQSGSMKAIWNNIRAVDLLEADYHVDPDRIGVIGHSLGGHNALFTAAFDQRLRAVVTSCGFTAFHQYYEGNLKGWTSDRYMPRIREQYHNNPDEVPFDFYEVIAAIAPRPLFINAPLHDSNFAIEGVRKVVAKAAPIYEFTNGKGKLKAVYPDSAHDFPGDVREQAYRWLDHHLKK